MLRLTLKRKRIITASRTDLLNGLGREYELEWRLRLRGLLEFSIETFAFCYFLLLARISCPSHATFARSRLMASPPAVQLRLRART